MRLLLVEALSQARSDARIDHLQDLLEELDLEIADLGPSYPMLGANAQPIVDLDTYERIDEDFRTLSGLRHVGGEVNPTSPLRTVAHHGPAHISFGWQRDATPRDELVDFLESQAIAAGEWWINAPGLPTVEGKPVVRVVEGANQRFQSYIERAVRAINSALPIDRRLSIGAPLAVAEDVTLRETLDELPGGTIVVHAGLRDLDGRVIGPNSHYNAYGGHWTERADGTYTFVIEAGYIFMNADLERSISWGDFGELELDQNHIATIVHELMHALGFVEHTKDVESAVSYDTPFAKRMGHFLYRLDRDALLAAYDRLDPETPSDQIADDLGPWSEWSRHLVGEIALADGGDRVAFGAALGNGFVAPWANGPIPTLDLADNPALTDSASWSGRLLGMTPRGGAVAGSADLSIQLDTLNGHIDFASLEQWAGTRPGAIGSGTIWGDGDLGYTIGVQGNVFVQTGGDDGYVTVLVF